MKGTKLDKNLRVLAKLKKKKKKEERKKRRLSLWLYSHTLVLFGKSKF